MIVAQLNELGVEEIQNEFAKGHCARASDEFLGYPRLNSPKRGAHERDQTTTRANKHQTNKSPSAASAPSSGRTRCSNVSEPSILGGKRSPTAREGRPVY